VDPDTQPTGTPSTSTQAIGTQTTNTKTTSTPVTGMSKEYWDKLERREMSTIRLYLADSVVVGKYPCGQVDCLKELDLNSKTKNG
jgi:hypothetical protein